MAIDTGNTDNDLQEDPRFGSSGDDQSLRETLESQFKAQADAPEAIEKQPGETDAQAAQRVRDERGRFAKGEAQAQDQGKPAQDQGKPATQQAAPAQAGFEKPPASWTPVAREKWAGLDPEVRSEVYRREREHQQYMQQSAGSRQFVEAFERTIKPFEQFIAAEGANPLQAVQNLMQTAAQLRVGAPAAKAQLVAQIVQQYGIDIGMLDSALAAGPQQRQQPQAQQFRDPRVDQILQQQQQSQQMQEQQIEEAIGGELQTFAADPAHEFFQDVRGIMADLVEVAAKQGVVLSVDDAYERACQINPQVRTIITQRSQASNAGTLTQAALRAKRAASSVRGDSTLPGNGARDRLTPKDDSVRGILEAQFAQARQA
jgi:hypothetical protein